VSVSVCAKVCVLVLVLVLVLVCVLVFVLGRCCRSAALHIPSCEVIIQVNFDLERPVGGGGGEGGGGAEQEAAASRGRQAEDSLRPNDEWYNWQLPFVMNQLFDRFQVGGSGLAAVNVVVVVVVVAEVAQKLISVQLSLQLFTILSLAVSCVSFLEGFVPAPFTPRS
jgi:hypothetical protein